jgi:hypothetical protein
MSEFVAVKGLIVRKDNIAFVSKSLFKDIQFGITTNNFNQVQTVTFEEDHERDRVFDKIMVALTGDLE